MPATAANLRRVLVVDDYAPFRRSIRRTLEGNLPAEECATIERAWAFIQKEHFTMAIVDVHFERGPNGVELLRRIRADGRLDALPVLMITGELFDQEGECLREGADAFLVKPFSRAALFDSIEAATASRRAARVLRGARFLHVEDDDAWADLIKQWLSGLGASVERFRTRCELLKRGATLDYTPDAVLLDLGLPDADGLALCSEVKESPRLQAAPVIVLTSRVEARAAALRHQAVHLVEKGLRAREEFISVVSTVVNQHRLSQGRLVLPSHGMEFDPVSGQVRRDGRLVVTLAGRHKAVFHLLVKRSPEPVSREEIAACVPDRASAAKSARTADTYVSSLRQLLAKELAEKIVSVFGVGYAFVESGILPPA